MHVILITEDDLSNIYTVEEAVHKIGFGVFQILLSLFCGAAAVSLLHNIIIIYICMYVCRKKYMYIKFAHTCERTFL